jgi:hypothetical protein
MAGGRHAARLRANLPPPRLDHRDSSPAAREPSSIATTHRIARPLLAVAVASLVLSAPAAAAPPTRAELPKPCREWGGADVLALACDPGGRAAEIHLRLGAEQAGASGERGIARLSSDEPLQAGETVSLRWRHPSARACRSCATPRVSGAWRPSSRCCRSRSSIAARRTPTRSWHAPIAADPRGDVVVQEASERARDQAAHADVDLTGVGLAGRCLAIRSAGPLPARFEITLRDDRDAPDRELEVAVTDGRVVVLDTTEDDIVPKPLRGAAAHLDPDGLVVSLPVTLSGTVQVVLGVDRSQVRYSDDASVLRGAR